MAVMYMEIDVSQLNSDIRSLKEGTEQAKKNLNSMLQEMEELNAMWQGRANQAFREQVEKDKAAIEKLLERLTYLSECMDYASGEYMRCENEVKDAVEAIRI